MPLWPVSVARAIRAPSGAASAQLAPPLPLRRPTPHAVLDAVGERVREALAADRAAGADALGHLGADDVAREERRPREVGALRVHDPARARRGGCDERRARTGDRSTRLPGHVCPTGGRLGDHVPCSDDRWPFVTPSRRMDGLGAVGLLRVEVRGLEPLASTLRLLRSTT